MCRKIPFTLQLRLSGGGQSYEKEARVSSDTVPYCATVACTGREKRASGNTPNMTAAIESGAPSNEAFCCVL